jgi:hypothetical protein
MSGQRLKIDRDHLIQMVRSLDFYMEVPAFMYLKEAGMTSWRMYEESEECKKCHNEWKHMRGVCDALFMKLRDLKEENSPALEDIRNWLSKRKGYAVGKVVLYYRRSKEQGKIVKFEF